MNRIKELRTKKGLLQKELAAIVGRSVSAISQWESGKYEVDNDSLFAMANVFNVSVDYLLGRDDSAETKKEAALESDDFTYALYGEFRHLSDADKEQLLNMARFLRQQQEAKNGKNGKSD